MYVLVIYALLCIAAWADLFSKKRLGRAKQGIILAAVMLFFLFRLNEGRDIVTYARLYTDFDMTMTPTQWFNGYYWNGRFPLWAGWMFLLKSQGFDFTAFLFLTDLIIIGLCTYIIYKYSTNWLISLSIFVGSGALNVYYTSSMRQMLVMAIFLAAFYKYLLNGKYWRYYFLMILCFFIHKGAVFTLLLPFLKPLADLFWDRKPAGIIALLLWLGAVLCFAVFPARVAGFFPSEWGRQLLEMQNTSVSVPGAGLQIVLLLLILGLYHYASPDVKHQKKTRYQILVCIFAFMIYIIFIRLPIMSRVSDFLTIIHIILIPNLVTSTVNQKRMKILLGGVMLLNLFLCYVDLRDGMSGMYVQSLLHYPYVSVFNPMASYASYDWKDAVIRW